MNIIDVHAHLCDPVFDADRAEVLARAREAGIVAIVAVARKNQTGICLPRHPFPGVRSCQS